MHVHHTLISLSLARAESPPYNLFHTNSIHAHKVYSCTQTKPLAWREQKQKQNKNKNKKQVQNSRHHDRPHHLVLPTHFTTQRLQSPWPPSPSYLTTHFTAQRLQSLSCLSHTLHATEATVTTAAVRPPAQCKHSETRRTRKRKRKKRKRTMPINWHWRLAWSGHARPCKNTRHTNNETKQGSRRPVAVWNTAGYGNTLFLPLPSGCDALLSLQLTTPNKTVTTMRPLCKWVHEHEQHVVQWNRVVTRGQKPNCPFIHSPPVQQQTTKQATGNCSHQTRDGRIQISKWPLPILIVYAVERNSNTEVSTKRYLESRAPTKQSLQGGVPIESLQSSPYNPYRVPAKQRL